MKLVRSLLYQRMWLLWANMWKNLTAKLVAVVSTEATVVLPIEVVSIQAKVVSCVYR